MARTPVVALLSGSALAAAAVAAVAFVRGPAAPTPLEVLAGEPGHFDRCLVGAVSATGSVVLLFALAWSPWRGRSWHAFGSLVSVPLAAAVPLGLGLQFSSWIAPCLGVVVGLALAVAVARTLSGRGLVSLAFGGAVAALPTAFAVRAARALAIDCAPMAAARQSLSAADPKALGLLLESDVDETLLRAVRTWFAPPWRSRPIDVFAARAESPAAKWLVRQPLPLFAAHRLRWRPLVGGPPKLRASQAIPSARVVVEDGTLALAIALRDVAKGAEIHVLTPFGSASGASDGEAVRFEAEERQRLAAYLAAMPAGAALRIVVVPPDPADPPTFTEVRP